MVAELWNQCPELQNLAVRVLSQTASSSEAERNWSLFGFIQDKKRYSLKASTMEKLVYTSTPTLGLWTKLLMLITKNRLLNGVIVTKLDHPPILTLIWRLINYPCG